MSFLQPFVLAALAAAAVPLLLHLLNLRRLRVVPFSTLSFLKTIQRSRIRAVRLRQLLLLLIRTLLVVFLVLGFARPVFHGGTPSLFGESASTDAVILVDNSMSMTTRNEHGELFTQALDAARRISGSLQDQDRIAVLPLSRIASAQSLPPAFLSSHSAESEIRGLKLSAVTVPLRTGILEASSLLRGSQAANKEIYVLSDFQRSLSRTGTSDRGTSTPNARTFLIRVGETHTPDLGLHSVILNSSIVDRGLPITFEVTVRNGAPDQEIAAHTSVFLESSRADQRVRQIPPGADDRFTMNATPQTTGLVSGSVLLEGDDIEFDNRWAFALRIPAERSVLVVGSKEDDAYLSLALTGRTDGAATGFSVTQVSSEQVTGAMLRDNDLYVLSEPLRSDLRETLQGLVTGGRGLILFPPSKPERFSDFAAFASHFGIGFDGIRTVSANDGFLRFGRVDLRHPLFEGMFSETPQSRDVASRRRLESPDVTTYAHVRPGTASTSIVDLTNGDPVIIEHALGDGKVLALALAMTPSWSTFPLTGLFVPLMHRAAALASNVEVLRPMLTAGEQLRIPLTEEMSHELSIVPPDKQAVPVQPTVRAIGLSLEFGQTDQTGVYQIFSGPTEIDRFAVHMDPAESDLRPLSDDALTTIADSSGLDPARVTILEGVEGIVPRLHEARVGSEYWQTMFLVVLALMLAEWWLSRAGKADAPPEGAA